MLGALLVVLLAPQDAPDSSARFRWPPPASAPTASYRIELFKARTLEPGLSQAERAARRAAGLYAPSRPPRQELTLVVRAELTPDADRIAGAYSLTVVRESLRWELIDEPAGDSSPIAFDRLWGPPDQQRDANQVVARNRIEGEFLHATRRNAPLAAPPDAPDGHLLPVFWEGALPAWIEHVIAVAELDGVPVVPGKRLIRESIVSNALGQRTSRAVVSFVRASPGGVELEYGLTVTQRADHRRSDGSRLDRPFEWRIEVQGEAAYAPASGHLERLDERVKGYPLDPPADLLLVLRDEAFEGRIRLELVPKETTGERPERRRRRS
ncbi:MAG: hypothetical protein IPM29_04895 [Planctomycetes bacterium]|nr:hypothetical protein [Planctomycetota bacterium]